MWPFTSKPKIPIRSTIDGATVQALLDLALKGRKRADYRHIATKGTMSVVTREDVETASKKAHRPWLKDRWECEQQALEVVQCGQKIAANEDWSWAMGILRARAPRGLDGLHVYVFAVVLTAEGRFAGRDVVFYDPTARQWVSAAELNDVDYSMT